MIFAMPCATADGNTYVMAFLSALATPLVRRFETWLPDRDGLYLLRSEGFCEVAGTLDSGRMEDRIESGQGVLGQALAWGEPGVSQQAEGEAGGVGASARAAGLHIVVALPVLQGTQVVAVVAWYF